MSKAQSSKPSRPRHNWTALRREYVQTDISLREMAAKHGIGERQLSDHCKREGWVSQREQFRSKVSAIADERAADENAAQLVKGRKIAAQNALMTLALTAAKLGMKPGGASSNGALIKQQAAKLSSLDIMRLARANDVSYAALCQALGVPVLDVGSSDVELPGDPVGDLAAGVGAQTSEKLAAYSDRDASNSDPTPIPSGPQLDPSEGGADARDEQ